MDYSTLTNDQVNERLAVEVMRWRIEVIGKIAYWVEGGLKPNQGTAIHCAVSDWQPADPEHLHQTVMCAEKLGNGWKWSVSSETQQIDTYVGIITPPQKIPRGISGGMPIPSSVAVADSPERALAEAILQAVDNG